MHAYKINRELTKSSQYELIIGENLVEELVPKVIVCIKISTVKNDSLISYIRLGAYANGMIIYGALWCWTI